MPIFYITVPVTTALHMAVEAPADTTEAEIFALALEQDFRLKCESEYGIDIADEVGVHQHLNHGNVCHAVYPELSIDEVEK